MARETFPRQFYAATRQYSLVRLGFCKQKRKSKRKKSFNSLRHEDTTNLIISYAVTVSASIMAPDILD